jgi:hypothetical protein
MSILAQQGLTRAPPKEEKVPGKHGTKYLNINLFCG